MPRLRGLITGCSQRCCAALRNAAESERQASRWNCPLREQRDVLSFHSLFSGSALERTSARYSASLESRASGGPKPLSFKRWTDAMFLKKAEAVALTVAILRAITISAQTADGETLSRYAATHPTQSSKPHVSTILGKQAPRPEVSRWLNMPGPPR